MRILILGGTVFVGHAIDARDLGEWIVKMAEDRVMGIFNATGRPVAMSSVLDTCREVSRGDARFEWIDEATMEREKVQPWKDMPLWIPESDPHAAGFMDIPIDRALASGLRHGRSPPPWPTRSNGAQTRPADHAWKAGLTAQREAALLAAAGRR